MRFAQAKTVLRMPVPQVYAWSSDTSSNTVQCQYIIMERVPGVPLKRVWDGLSAKQKVEIVRQLAAFGATFAATRFSAYGSLYFAKDLPEASRRGTLYVGPAGTDVPAGKFAIGPSTAEIYNDGGRAAADFDRGPCTPPLDDLEATHS